MNLLYAHYAGTSCIRENSSDLFPATDIVIIIIIQVKMESFTVVNPSHFSSKKES